MSDLQFRYRNTRGEISNRNVEPIGLWHGESIYHAGPQWFLIAHDHDRNGHIRYFALRDILRFDGPDDYQACL